MRKRYLPYLFFLILAILSHTLVSASDSFSICPSWTIGDWWTVDSQLYNRGGKVAGDTPHWLPKVTWLFSVVSTNSIEDQPCYQVMVRTKDSNSCPYWFYYWLRMSDFLVMCRELHQPTFIGTGHRVMPPIVKQDYSKDSIMPFVPYDFPSLPMCVPIFAGGTNNVYRIQPRSSEVPQKSQRTVKWPTRTYSATVIQTFSPGEKLQDKSMALSSTIAAVYAAGAVRNTGLYTLTYATNKYERQAWSVGLPWHVYTERSENGETIKKCWLLDYGHADQGSPLTDHGDVK